MLVKRLDERKASSLNTEGMNLEFQAGRI